MKDLMEKLIAQMVDAGLFFQDAVSEFEQRYIRKVLEINQGNQSQAAKALGIHRNTLRRKLAEYQLTTGNGSQPSRTLKPRKPKKPIKTPSSKRTR